MESLFVSPQQNKLEAGTLYSPYPQMFTYFNLAK